MSSSSRLRKDVATLFDVFCISRISEQTSGSPVVTLSNIYPSEYNDEPTLRSVKQFSFPCGIDREDTDAVQLFTFVLTDAQSLYTFAYCRYTPRSNTCFCLLSGLPWTNFFYKLLNHLSSVSNKGTAGDLDSVLTNAYHIDLPGPGAQVSLNACTWKFCEEVPDPSHLPTLRDDKFMLEFYNAMSEKQMVVLYSSLLKERRILFTSRKLSQLSSCVFAASRLLYPFYWQNLFIPILPAGLSDMLMAPMPFIIGVPKKTFDNFNRRDLGDVVLVDLDEKTIESPYNDALPADALLCLKSLLKSSSEMFLSDSLARAFLKTNALLFGRYRLGLLKKPELMEVTWDREKFVRDQRPSLQPYLESLMGRDGVQYFERFIEERLEALNRGLPFNDEFEREVTLLSQRSHGEKTSLLQSNTPEMLHSAVASVKENASDVIFALKDKVQGISLRNTLGRLTPNEMRRKKKAKTKKKHLTPLSVDATVFDWNNPLATTSTRNGAEDALSASDAESAKSTGDLIDFSDDSVSQNSRDVVNPKEEDIFGSSAPSFANHSGSSSNIEKSLPVNLGNSMQSPSSNGVIKRVPPATNQSLFKLYPSAAFPDVPDMTQYPNSSNVPPQTKWETFE